MKNRKSFFAGMLTMALLFSLVVSASAVYANVTKTLSYQDIKVTLNGDRLDLRDANGKAVDPFIIDGTTYLPVRAVSESLGLDVGWDHNTKTVILSGNVSESPDIKYLLAYYMSMENASEKLQSIYIDFSTGNYRLYSDTSPITEDGLSFSASLAQQLQSIGESVEKRYSDCKSNGLSSDSDFEMLIEFRRLNTKAISILNDFASGCGSDSLFISSISAPSTQNAVDSTYLWSDASTAFWNICND